MCALWDLKGATAKDRPLRLESFLVFVLVLTGSMTPAQGFGGFAYRCLTL